MGVAEGVVEDEAVEAGFEAEVGALEGEEAEEGVVEEVIILDSGIGAEEDAGGGAGELLLAEAEEGERSELGVALAEFAPLLASLFPLPIE